MLTIKPDWTILLTSDDPVARFAAAELRRTLQRIGAPPLPIAESAAARRIVLECGAAGDGFTRGADAGGLRLAGEGPRGLLYGVYDLLEALGCRWVAPGHDGELLPRYDYVQLPGQQFASWPAVQGRCLVLGHDFFLQQAEEWIVWAARNRLNTLFIHTTQDSLALGACRLESWRARREVLLPLLRERGMTLELGGHGMSALVPRSLWGSVPQAFRHNGRRRTPDRNFCPNSPEAQALLRLNGAAALHALGEAPLLHLWPDDGAGDDWCRCPRCAVLSPSDQALLAVNILAEGLSERHPGARIAHLAYQDTQPAPTRVIPHPNVALTFAPRERSYGVAIGDPDSAVNATVMADLRQNMAWFGDAKNPGAVRVFEYYLDGLLFKSAPPPLLDVLPGDLRAYREAGVHTVQALMTGDRPWLAAPINGYLFARLAWNPRQASDDLLADYAATRSPRQPEPLQRAYRALAAAWQPALALVPDEAGRQRSVSLSGAPPCDMLDYMAAPRPIRERRMELITRALPQLDAVALAWREVLAAPDAPPFLAAERAEHELSALQLSFVALRQRLYVLEGRDANQAALLAALAEAQHGLDAMLAWGAMHLPSGRAQASFALLRQVSQLQLDALHSRSLGPLRRVGLRARSYGRVGGLLARLKIQGEKQ